jgi:hypothetical protein
MDMFFSRIENFNVEEKPCEEFENCYSAKLAEAICPDFG